MDSLLPPLVLGHENIWQAGRGLDHDPADEATHRHGLPGDWRPPPTPFPLPPCALPCTALLCPVSALSRVVQEEDWGDALGGKT